MKPVPPKPRKRLPFTERPKSWGKDDPDVQYDRERDRRTAREDEKKK